MKIGLVPMSAKPYHAGHHVLVMMAAADNEEVRLFVSTSDRKREGEMHILGSDMRRIWEEHIAGIIPSNVRIEYGGSPVQKVYDTLEIAEAEAKKSKNTNMYTVYSDPADTNNNYPIKYRLKYFPTLLQNGQVKFAAEENPERFTRGMGTPDVSGTAMRAAIERGDREAFWSGMPPGIDADAVFDILSPKTKQVSEQMLRALIRSIL